MLSETALKALNAYGGGNIWKQNRFLEADVSVKGLAFTLKRRPFFKHAKIVMEIGSPRSRLTPIGKDHNITGVLDGRDVWLEDESGKILAERRDARKYFPFGRRLLYWDDLDMAYFANYAFWNYFTFPYLLMNESIAWKERAPGILDAVFPDSLPTHSKIQEFYLHTDSGRLMQHNYTADIISKYATVANVITGHSEAGGIAYPSHRSVTPRSKSGKPLRGPLMIDISVHSSRLSNDNILDFKLKSDL